MHRPLSQSAGLALRIFENFRAKNDLRRWEGENWHPAVLFTCIVLIAAGIYVALGLNQSSIGVWEAMYPARPVEQTIDLGSPKRVRSDEWNTQTPWILGQVSNGFLGQNVGIGGNDAPVIAGVPVANLSLVAQPKFYGFLFLDKGHGFSWLWAYKSFGLILSCFFAIFLLSGRSIWISIIGSLWVYLSASTQWWLSSHLPEQLTALFSAVSGAALLLTAASNRMLVAGAVLFAYGLISTLLHAYPPFQVPFAYIGVAICLGVVLCLKEERGLGAAWKTRVGGMVAALTVVAGFTAWYTNAALPAIDAMRGTVYPGSRVSESGGIPIFLALSGAFEAFSITEKDFPSFLGNASEASSFLIVPPLILLLGGARLLRSAEFRKLVPLLLLWVLVFAWICFELPDSIEKVYQVAGWSLSPPPRALLGLGLLSVFTLVLHAGLVEAGRLAAPRYTVSVAAWTILLCLYGWVFYRCSLLDPDFFNVWRLLTGIVLITCVHFGSLHGKPVWFAPVIAILLPNIAINPLTSGISALADKPVLLAARNQTYSLDNRWVVIGDFVLSQGLKSQGLNVVSGSALTPNPSYMHVFDRSGRYAHVWNRYAHIAFESQPPLRQPQFDLNQPDLFVIRLNVCGPELDALHVTRVAYTTPVPVEDLRCLTPLESPSDSGIRLFVRK